MIVKYIEAGQVKEIDLPEALALSIAAVKERGDHHEAAAVKMATTWKHILKLFDLEGKSAGAVMLQIPRLISKIQREPELFNFIDPELNRIIEKYAKP